MNDQDPRQPDSSEHPESIGPYLIQGTLGAGGMAVVYRAVQQSLDREVAIKVLPAASETHADAIARFERESTLVSKLTHPGIIQIFDRGIEDDRYYIVMEYIRGCSLEDLIREGKLSIHEIIDIGLQIAKGLAYAHSKGVVHRDIKPGNILVSSDSGVVKIADFGIAQFAEAQLAGETLTRENTGMGTINYMAPEQRLDASGVDHRADIFAFGVILYELLTRKLPLGHFKAPIELRDDTPPKLSGLVMRCLQQAPAERYQTFDVLIADLEKVTVLNLQYRETLAKMASTVRRMSGKSTTRMLVQARGVLSSWPWRLIMAGLGGVLVLALVVLSVRVIVSGDDDGSSGAGSDPVVTDTAPQGAYRERFDAAETMRARGDYGEALTSLRAIRTEANEGGNEPAWGEAQWRVAEIHREVGNSSSAAIAYGYFYNTFSKLDAFEDSPKIPASLFWAAHFKENQKKHEYEQAIFFYRQLYTDFPQHAKAGEALFRISYLMDEEVKPPRGTDSTQYYARAARGYQRVIEEYRDLPVREEAFYRLGQMYEEHKQIRDYARAAQLYEDMAAAYPSSGYEPLYHAAQVVDRKLDDESRAVELYKEFLTAQPNAEHADDARSRLKRLR